MIALDSTQVISSKLQNLGLDVKVSDQDQLSRISSLELQRILTLRTIAVTQLGDEGLFWSIVSLEGL